MALDWSRCPEVMRSPDVLGGAWVLKDTRVPVAGIFSNIESGLPIDEIPEVYEGVTVAQARAVIHFAAQSLEDLPMAV